MAIAIRASVTVSIALDTSGTRNVMRLDSGAAVATSLGIRSDSAGKRSTSSKVSPSGRSIVRPRSSGRPWPTNCSVAPS
jgi:hypothetical protein